MFKKIYVRNINLHSLKILSCMNNGDHSEIETEKNEIQNVNIWWFNKEADLIQRLRDDTEHL